MAKGDQFAFKDYPDVPRVCHDCGKKLKLADVRDVHEIPERFFRCTDCWPPPRHAIAGVGWV